MKKKRKKNKLISSVFSSNVHFRTGLFKNTQSPSILLINEVKNRPLTDANILYAK